MMLVIHLCSLIAAVLAEGDMLPYHYQNTAFYPQRRKTSAKSLITMILLQENQKLAEKLEQVKVDNELSNLALQTKLAALEKKIETQPRSTRCYMGMKFGDIPDSAITASSQVDVKHSPARARLDTEMTGDNFRGGWAASTPVSDEWIQVDLGSSLPIAGVILQGRSDMNEWVKTYKVQCDAVTIQEYGVDKIFIGNTDRDSQVVGKFHHPLKCQIVRIVPVSFQVHVTLRFELINGKCFDEY